MKKQYVTPAQKTLDLSNEEFIAHSKELDATFPNDDQADKGDHIDDPDNPVWGDAKKNLWDEEW